jgi:alpha,alpha-trehalose phosphorylase
MAGSCIAAIAGFGGLRDRDAALTFIPRLPQALTRLAFTICWGKKATLKIEVEPTRATYTLLRGEALEIHHHGRPITVTSDHAAHCPIPPAPALERPTQPRGREPAPAAPVRESMHVDADAASD